MIRGVLANIYDKGAVAAVQLITIPLLTNAWGADGYGVWLMLMTVPTYLALSDFGFGTAAGVALTGHATRGEFALASVVLHSTVAFNMSCVLVAAALALSFSFWFSLSGASVAPFSSLEIAVSIALIAVYSTIFSVMSILIIAFRATNKYAYAMFFTGTWILIEGLALIVLISHHYGLVEVCLALVFVRGVGCFFFSWSLKKKEPWATIGIKLSNWSQIRSLAGPSLGAFSLTVAAVLSLQGMIIVLGIVAGPASVALYAAARTICRLPLQISGLLIRPSLPELTRAIVSEDRELKRKLILVNLVFTSIVVIPFGIAVMISGPSILLWLSKGHLQAPQLLFVALVIGTVANAFWTVLATPIIAINRQSEFSYMALVLAIITLALLYVLSSSSATVAAVIAALSEFIMLAVIVMVLGRIGDR